MPDSTDAPPRLSQGLTRLLALTAGLAVASIYYSQPVVGQIARDLAVSEAATTWVVTLTQLGYAAGLVLLVPLGDCVDRRRMMLWLTAALMLAMVAAALAPALPLLLAASVLVGAAATLAQQALPFAAELADERDRGAVVGSVMSGLLAGILLARVLSGIVADYLGWRAVFLVAAALTMVLALVLWHSLPHSRPGASGSYRALLGSMPGLLRRYPALRRAAAIQGLLFAGFSAFWSTLVLLLETPAFGLGSMAAGLFGALGLAGVLVAPLAGRMADRHGANPVVGAGLGLVLAGFLVVGGWPALAGLALGVVLLDAGNQAAMVGHQSVVFALDAAARSRVNTVFMTVMFLGGAAGSAGGGAAWSWAGWRGVCGLGIALALAALAVHLTGRYRRRAA